MFRTIPLFAALAALTLTITLTGEDAARPALVCRFLREARITGQLQHPGIVPVHGLGRLPDGRPCLLMKRVDGRALDVWLARRGAPGEAHGVTMTRPSECRQPPPREPLLIIGVGASAGGLQAARDFLRPFPADCGLAFVALFHLDPSAQGLLPEQLAKATSLPVVEVTDVDVTLELEGGMGHSTKAAPPGTIPEVGDEVAYDPVSDAYQPPGRFPSREDTPWTHGGPPPEYLPTEGDATEEWV